MKEEVPLILIGGASRVGKTTLVHKLLRLFPHYTLSTDRLKDMVQKISDIKSKPSSKNFPYPSEWLDLIRKRDYEIWQWAKEYIISAVKEDIPLIVEGNLWADYIYNDLEEIVKINPRIKPVIIFLVDTSKLDISFNRFVELRKDPLNWLNKYSDIQLNDFAKCNQLRAYKSKELSQKYNYFTYDINDYKSLDEMQEEIIEKLRMILNNP